ncbi:MAG TPA: type II toxin-antitoxin system VapC family toxin [Acetobacteraceae bacterium]|nr:type II toxin-antitoxin system VapC family toxin [Acetobacteraceae bacterium]
MILVDSDALFDIITNDTAFAAWSAEQLDHARLSGRVSINDVIYAAFSVRYRSPEEVDGVLGDMGIDRRPMPGPALFLAGKAFLRDRRCGGTRSGVLADFFIGAQAAVEGLTVLTRDPRRYRMYFPSVALVTPEA